MSNWVVVCVTHHRIAKGVQPMQETALYGIFERRLDAAQWEQGDEHICPGDHYYWVINSISDAGRGSHRTIHDELLEEKGPVVPTPRQPLGLETAGLTFSIV